MLLRNFVRRTLFCPFFFLYFPLSLRIRVDSFLYSQAPISCTPFVNSVAVKVLDLKGLLI